MFGYVTVLPGAFSAYRYIALQNGYAGEGPLQTYFLGETMVCPPSFLHDCFDMVFWFVCQPGSEVDIFTANMYLAEDRVRDFSNMLFVVVVV